MADISRAMNTPPPATQQQQATPGRVRDPINEPFTTASPVAQTARGTGEKAAVTRADNAAREAKNERDRLRRKAQRMAALQVAAKPKKKKAKKRKAVKLAAPTKAKRRGRPPGAKNKPKLGLAVALVPTPGVLPRGRAKTASLADNSLLAQINSAVLLLNAMPEQARKIVLDAVK